jgi:hypothetical protein
MLKAIAVWGQLLNSMANLVSLPPKAAPVNLLAKFIIKSANRLAASLEIGGQALHGRLSEVLI